MKLGFLFGAGAEVGYGLPTGGKFALDIFRQDTTGSKEAFKEMRRQIAKDTTYAASWLPEDYSNKNISSYGKTVFESIIKDTIEHNRDKIIQTVNKFDDFAKAEIECLKKSINQDVKKTIEQKLGESIENINMKHVISFIQGYEEGNLLFANNYFSALLKIYKRKDVLSPEEKREMSKIISAIIQLLIGALTEKFTGKINDGLFYKKDDNIDILDDLGDVIKLNYQATGLTGMEYLLEKRKSNTDTAGGLILRFAQGIIEAIYAAVLDYKSLVDSNWYYLYCPKNEWAKFCKISIFLMTVRAYILEQAESVDVTNKTGYYNDLKSEIDQQTIEISKIATTNYHKFISDILGDGITYLNGSTEKWYDPYLNKVDSEENLNKIERHFLVPLMFTKSGTKPMTSISISMEYVNTYNKWKESDAIVVIGFGFNSDDEHINGILRTLIDDDNKKMIVISLHKNQEDGAVVTEISKKLKIKKSHNIKMIQVDTDRKKEEKLWTKEIMELLSDDSLIKDG